MGKLNLSNTDKILYYFVGAIIGIFLLFLLWIIHLSRLTGEIVFGVPQGFIYELDFYLFLFIGGPVFLLFGLGLFHGIYNKKVTKFFAITLLPVLLLLSLFLYINLNQ